MRENITLNQEEQKRLYVLNQVIEGKLVGRKAAELLQRSIRQVRRWIAGYRRRGAVALIHGNRGRPPVNRVPKRTVNRVVKLARGGACQQSCVLFGNSSNLLETVLKHGIELRKSDSNSARDGSPSAIF